MERETFKEIKNAEQETLLLQMVNGSWTIFSPCLKFECRNFEPSMTNDSDQLRKPPMESNPITENKDNGHRFWQLRGNENP